jgi:hypothetical protein
MHDSLAIEVQGLHKRFGKIQAVQGVCFDVPKGQVFSLLGPNGAGKSTTTSMLACLLKPTEGDALVMGHSIQREPMAVRRAIGTVPQEIALYPDLSARENLAFWGKMYGLRGAALRQRMDEVLEVVGLTDRQKGPVSKFSGGMLGGLMPTGDPSRPGVFDRVSLLLPQGWAMRGWKLAVNGAGPAEVLLPVAVLVGVGLVLFAIGVLGFRRRFG